MRTQHICGVGSFGWPLPDAYRRPGSAQEHISWMVMMMMQCVFRRPAETKPNARETEGQSPQLAVRGATECGEKTYHNATASFRASAFIIWCAPMDLHGKCVCSDVFVRLCVCMSYQRSAVMMLPRKKPTVVLKWRRRCVYRTQEAPKRLQIGQRALITDGFGVESFRIMRYTRTPLL